jgi:8-oxo-dGTP diphosphatase
VEYEYPEFFVSMDCFFCRVVSGDLKLKEHEDAKWLNREEIGSVDWLPSDRMLLEKLFG